MNRTSWIFIAVTTTICLIIGFFFTRPNVINTLEIYKETQTAQSDLTQVSKKKEILTALADNNQLSNLFDIASKYIPEGNNSSELVIGLSAMATESNLGVDQLNFENATPTPKPTPAPAPATSGTTTTTSTTDNTNTGTKDITFSMTVSGTFPNFLNFLKSTETSSRLITFSKMSFSQTGKDFIAQLSGTSYWKKGNTLETTLDNIKISKETIDKFQNLKSYGTPIDLPTESGFGRTNPFDAFN